MSSRRSSVHSTYGRHIYFFTITFVLFIFDNVYKTNAFTKLRRSVGDLSKWPVPNEGPEQAENWFEQKLDHFDKKHQNTTWKQLYYTNDTFYRNERNAPIFLTIGGELPISPRWVTKGAWIRYAEHFGAMCFHLEHRFYGRSRPKGDLSFENLQFLSSQQALADVANFIRGMNSKYNFNDNQKWIVFGGSYPGALAAWAREKYPQLINGAISSSAPLLAKVDFFEYFEVVKASLATHSTNCLKTMGLAFAEIETLTHHEIGQYHLDEIFNTCTLLCPTVTINYRLALPPD